MSNPQTGTLPSLSGRVALVTGASRGIGRAIAQRFAAAGATAVVTARSLGTAVPGRRAGGMVVLPGTLEETVQLIEQAGGTAIAIACDLEDPAQRAALVQNVLDIAGRLDILVNNAGFADYVAVEAMDDAVYQLTLDHYLTAPFVLCRAAIPVMRAQGRGWILNIGSSIAQRPLPANRESESKSGAVIYAAVKAAIARFTQGLALELYDDNIAVNLVAPSGAIRTPGASALIPERYSAEPIEYIAATALDLVHRPAAEQTGIVAHSLHYAQHHGIPVTGLDGQGLLPPPVIPAWNHPDIIPSGLA
jgi:NAD(P)-dependent dehydrogenase (short-subunit alcohol dehydrogenase family)